MEMFLQMIEHHVSSLVLDDSENKSYSWVLAAFINFDIVSKKQETGIQSLFWEDSLE